MEEMIDITDYPEDWLPEPENYLSSPLTGTWIETRDGERFDSPSNEDEVSRPSSSLSLAPQTEGEGHYLDEYDPINYTTPLPRVLSQIRHVQAGARGQESPLELTKVNQGLKALLESTDKKSVHTKINNLISKNTEMINQIKAQRGIAELRLRLGGKRGNTFI